MLGKHQIQFSLRKKLLLAKVRVHLSAFYFCGVEIVAQTLADTKLPLVLVYYVILLYWFLENFKNLGIQHISPMKYLRIVKSIMTGCLLKQA